MRELKLIRTSFRVGIASISLSVLGSLRSLFQRRRIQRLGLPMRRGARLAPAVASVLLAAVGCQQKMASQPSYKPLQTAEFFPYERSARELPPGTVPRGHLRSDRPLFTGRHELVNIAQVEHEGVGEAASNERRRTQPGQPEIEASFVEEFPFPITEEVLIHGRNRYSIYCVVCHDPLGTGRGKIIERGFTSPPSYHIERLREAPPGRLFAVISEGYGSMPAYGKQIPPRDRWAIVAYLRALQLSQHFPEEQLTDAMRAELAQSTALASAAADRSRQAASGAPATGAMAASVTGDKRRFLRKPLPMMRSLQVQRRQQEDPNDINK